MTAKALEGGAFRLIYKRRRRWYDVRSLLICSTIKYSILRNQSENPTFSWRIKILMVHCWTTVKDDSQTVVPNSQPSFKCDAKLSQPTVQISPTIFKNTFKFCPGSHCSLSKLCSLQSNSTDIGH